MKKENEPKKELIFNSIMATVWIVFMILGLVFFLWFATFLIELEDMSNNQLFGGLIISIILITFIWILTPDIINDYVNKIRESYKKIK